jgi:hypothetical protein
MVQDLADARVPASLISPRQEVDRRHVIHVTHEAQFHGAELRARRNGHTIQRKAAAFWVRRYRASGKQRVLDGGFRTFAKSELAIASQQSTLR